MLTTFLKATQHFAPRRIPWGLAIWISVAVSFGQTDPSVVGQWSPVLNWPNTAVHAHLLPTGKVLFDSYYLEALTPYTWDPAQNAINPAAAVNYSIFCGGHSLLANGQLLVVSGHIADNTGYPYASEYDPWRNSWTRLPDIGQGRWYPTVTVLPNGDALVTAGDINPTTHNALPQIWQRATNTWRNLTSAQLNLAMYSRMFVAPNGKVFQTIPSTTSRYLDTKGTGAWSFVAYSNCCNRDYAPAVMYDNGKVMISGGNLPPTPTAEIIDLTQTKPAWSYTSPMNFPRRQHNATILPDGKVLITGGSRGNTFDDSTNPVFAAELWDPAAQSFTVMAGNTVYRGYHSTALLLPDGRVLSAGGNVGGRTAEIYSPPYLFKGSRPAIASAPASVTYGQSFDVATPDALSIAQVNWIRLGSVTHSFDQSQRINKLTFSQTLTGLSVNAPANGNLCPPGYYMLFVVNSSGVPSVASMVQIDYPILNQGTDGDVGGPGLSGSSSLSNGVYSVTGAGSGWGGTADQGNFSFWQLSGDGFLQARIVGPGGGQAGVMIRETLAASSTYAIADVTASGAQFDYRDTTGAAATAGAPSPTGFPQWVQIARTGNIFSASVSPDGIVWTPLAVPATINMAANVYIGLAVSSDLPGGSASSTFDNLTASGSVTPAADFSLSVSPAVGSVAAGDSTTLSVSTIALNAFAASVSLTVSGIPAGAQSSYSPGAIQGAGTSSLVVVTTAGTPQGSYPIAITATSGNLVHTASAILTVAAPVIVYGDGAAQDIGAPPLKGNTNITDNSYAVTGSGRDIWGTSDQFQFQYWQLTGDGTITAQVTSFTGLNANSTAGLMVRETLTAKSDYVFARVNPAHERMDFRLAPGVNASNLVTYNSAFPWWLRLSRVGNVFSGFGSADGVNWSSLGNQTVVMGAPVYIGFAVSAHDLTRLETAVFNHLTMTGAVTFTPNFGLLTDVQTVSVPMGGGSANWQVTGTALNGFPGNVALAVSALPGGVSTNFSPPSLVGSGSSALTLVVPSGVLPGSYPFTLSGVSGNLTRTVPLALVVGSQ